MTAHSEDPRPVPNPTEPLTKEQSDWPRRFAVYAFDLDGYDSLTPEQKQVCDDAAVWAARRVAEALEAELARRAVPVEPPGDTKPTNRFSHWATDLLTSALRDLIVEDDRPSNELLNAIADRLDALYYAPPSTPEVMSTPAELLCVRCDHPEAGHDANGCTVRDPVECDCDFKRGTSPMTDAEYSANQGSLTPHVEAEPR